MRRFFSIAIFAFVLIFLPSCGGEELPEYLNSPTSEFTLIFNDSDAENTVKLECFYSEGEITARIFDSVSLKITLSPASAKLALSDTEIPLSPSVYEKIYPIFAAIYPAEYTIITQNDSESIISSHHGTLTLQNALPTKVKTETRELSIEWKS